jgi:3-oxoacyl-[acyl-carrier protein] reductase
MISKESVALITGASRGVGRATALALAKLGCPVAVNFRSSQNEAEDTWRAVQAEGAPSALIQGDTASDADCRKLVAETIRAFGRLDIVINNAATTRFVAHDQMEALDQELWDRIFAVNVRGPFQIVRAARTHLEQSPNAHVINITSIAGINGNGSSIPYCASKAAMINMTQSLARALAPQVQVNSVAPGFIETKWTADGLGTNYDAALEKHRENSAMKTVCQPEDVADAVMSLLTGSKLVTGQTLVCDAGAMIGSK